MAISRLRREYTRGGLREADVAADPFVQFRRWFDEARAADRPEWFEVNAMTLATATADGAPSARIVLLKELDDRGLVFYTHFTSRKGRELDANPQAAALFFWPLHERQVRFDGTVERLPREQAETYFHQRPRLSQLGALASDQSSPLPDRETLERHLEALGREYEGREIPMPDSWGGYRLLPETVELWQGGEGRLHDRLVYTRSDGRWSLQRLAP